MSSFAPGPNSQTPIRPSLSGRLLPPTMADLRRRAHARLAEKVDLVRSRHKPLSLLRTEAKRILDGYFDTECSALPKPEREKLTEDVMAESPGIWPLEELLRDDSVPEMMVLGAGLVIIRKGDIWLPANVRFRDAPQFRAVLARLVETGEALATPALGGFDIRLPNGFRVLAIIPPDVMEQPPMAMLVRPVPGATTPPPTSNATTTPTSSGTSSVLLTPAPRIPQPTPVAAASSPFSTARIDPSDSGILARTPGTTTNPSPRTGPLSGTSLDPLARIRQRVIEQLINKLAAAGVYDWNMIPGTEMRRIVAAHVSELSIADRLGLDEPTVERLTLEIVSSMK